MLEIISKLQSHLIKTFLKFLFLFVVVLVFLNGRIPSHFYKRSESFSKTTLFSVNTSSNVSNYNRGFATYTSFKYPDFSSIQSDSLELITNITNYTSRKYILSELKNGASIYSDRSYLATAVPDVLSNVPFIQVPNDDKGSKAATVVSFNLTQSATVYIAYDPRAKVLPAWLNDWEKLPMQIGINDPKITFLQLYRKNYPAGKVSLGGNLASPASGALNNYIIIARSLQLQTTYSLVTNSVGFGKINKTPDQITYENGATVTLMAVPDSGQKFIGWSGSVTGTTNPLNITMDGDKSVTATYESVPIEYTLSVVNNGSGTITKSPNQNTYASGANVTLMAIPDSGQRFIGWSGSATGTANPLTITMDGDKSVTATYEPVPVEYSLSVVNNGSGTITKSPSQNTYVSGSNVTLMAIPDSGQKFIGWSGSFVGTTNPLTITMDGDKSVTATYEPIPVEYSLSVVNHGSGTITKSPSQNTYVSGSNVTLMAVPDSGQKFIGWSGSATGTTNPITITMDGDKTVTATFEPIPVEFTLSVVNNGSGNVTKTPDKSAYRLGDTVTLTATPATDYKFLNWSGDITDSSDTVKIVLNRDIKIVCNFSPDPPVELITGIATTSTRKYLLDHLKIGSSIYTDRAYQTTLIPDFLENASFIKTPNDDKSSKSLSILTFNLNKSCTLIVAYDYRAKVLPGWLSGWQKLTPVIKINDGNNSSLLLYSRVFPAGQVSLGGNLASPASGALNNYIVIAQPSTSVSKFILFNQASESAEVEQGTFQTLPEYLSTSDNTPTSVTLSATDQSGIIPGWLTVNGKTLNGLTYTTGSEISFDLDATNLSIGTYSAVITATANGYNSATLNILLTVKSTSEGTPSSLKVNFQDAATIPPSGWLRDFGQSFGPRTSLYQGSGYKYGWLKKSDNSLLDLTKNGRKRNSPSDVLSATLMHMQGNDIANFSGTTVEGIWEAQVVNGDYDVIVSVGDGTEINSKHSINVEGVSAISSFVPTTSVKFKTATVSVTVADGFLTLDATGGTNTKINYVIIQPTTSTRPSVIAVNPENNSVNISENTSISTNILKLPNGGIDNSTITTANVYLTEEATGAVVPSNVNGTGGGDAITLVPSSPLKFNTIYNFSITDGVKDLSGASFIPYTSRFTTGSSPTTISGKIKFNKVALTNGAGRHSSLTMGPDGKLYALTIDGIIKRFSINSDGTLGTPELIYSLQDASGTRQPRLAIGLAFDPSSTASNLIAWVTHSTYVFQGGPDWDGKLTRLSGSNLHIVQDVLINLPRSAKDHLTNGIAFGPDGALYFTQGSNSAMGRSDKTWNYRDEHMLSGAVMRLDISKLGTQPLDVRTSEGGGTYNPFVANAPLTLYATGVRNAYDLVWHSNGSLYTPANGSAAGGNTPASVPGVIRTNGTAYNGPSIPALANVQQTQRDFLFRIQQGGYYGHPNPLRGEYVMNGGNPSSVIDPGQVNAYPVGTMPDENWRGYSFDFQNNASPNGVIEYKSNTFNGALKGKILVVRYSQHDDIITLTPGGTNNDIVTSVPGTQTPGFSGFVDPLDLAEDINTGNIYVSQYGGSGEIVLLRVDSAANSITGNSKMAEKASDQQTIAENKVKTKQVEVTKSTLFSMEETYGIDNNFEKCKLFPNPSHNRFSIRFPAYYKGNFDIHISDISGRSYEIGKITLKPGGADMKVDISKLSLKNGVYFLRIHSDLGRNEVLKLVIQ